LNNPDAQFLFSGLAIPAGTNGTPAFTPEAPLTDNGKYGDVVVQKGAILKSPSSSAKVGGRIALVGANVANEGTISTPDGQTILAAGLQVGFDAHSSNDPTLRGLDVFVGQVGEGSGTASNSGLIGAERGAITIAGREVNQLGMLDSTTSVSLNGRIDLQAQYGAVANRASASARGDLFLFHETGTVNLGEGSVMRILPELESTETAIGSELALRSQVNLTGRAIHFGEGSTLLAPSGLVDVRAGEWILSGGSSPVSRFSQSVGQVYLEEDALIDVSGSAGVSAPVSQNIISVDLRGAELADSPLQRLGILRNTTIQVDIRDAGLYQGDMWVGTPLADISGFANLIQRTAGQLTVAGGTVNISAGNSVVMQKGSKIDVSGGSTKFEAGTVKTTRLITDGRLVDISEATPDVVYDGIYNGTFTDSNIKFGISKIYQSSLAPDGGRFDPGSVEGGAGGKLSITSPSMALDGMLVGKTTQGGKQRLTTPEKSSLTLSFLAKDRTYANLPNFSPTPPKVIFQNRAGQDAAGPFTLDVDGNPLPLAESRKEEVLLSPEILTEGGFGKLTVNNNDGEILVSENVRLESAAGGSISFTASNITIAGSVVAPGGAISFTAPNLSLATLNQTNANPPQSVPAADPSRGQFLLGASAVVSTAGLLVDDRLDSRAPGQLPLVIDGGSISIDAHSAVLSSGGRLDVSGGATVNPRGAVSYGDGGALSISAGRDPGLSSVAGGTLVLGATLTGFSGAEAGSLSIKAPAIQIGGHSANAGVTVLDPDFFNQGGFGKFSLTGTGLASGEPGEFVTGLLISSEARIRPVVSGWLADLSGGKLRLSQVTRAEGVRASGSLSFNATGSVDPFASVIQGRGDVILEEGGVIQTDAKGSVTFSGDTVTLLGSVTTPGGSISVSGAARYPSNDPNLLSPTTLIGETARLSAAGTRLLLENPFGLRQGQILAGGSISISGNIAAERGAILDVSGASGILDLPDSASSLDAGEAGSINGAAYSPVEIHSNGGSITLTGARMLYSDAELVGRAGGASATGGSVTVSSGRFVEAGAPSNTAEANLVVRQNGFLVPEGFVSNGAGATLVAADGSPLPGIGTFNVSTFSSGGFDSLALGGNVRFDGGVTLKTPGSLRVASGGVIHADGRVKLEAGHVHLGQAFAVPTLPGQQVVLFTQTDASGSTTPFTIAPRHGDGSLTIKARLIDIGNLSLQGIGGATFNAARGDVRGNGTLSSAAELVFKAGQIYPTTAGKFNIFAYDHQSGGKTIQGSVSINSGADRALPFSAGGTLGIYASEITQGGTLRAPFGKIILGWDGTGPAPIDPVSGTALAKPVTQLLTMESGSVTSVSAVDPVTGKGMVLPYGISLDGNSWIDPAGNDITVGGVPGKTVNLSAGKVVTRKGSVIDISGGGDLYAYRWIPGNGGKNDVLASSGAFAVIPGYAFDYAPYAPFNPDASATKLGGAPGYVNGTLKVGDRITLGASKDLPAGTYTLLPARYALLPGAYLVTPQGGTAVGSVNRPEGATLVSGYRSNSLDADRSGQTLVTRFEISDSKVVRARSEYQDFLANTVLRDAAIAREFAVPRLPVDAGYLSFSSTGTLSLAGDVASQTPASGRGSLIDISSPGDILINKTGTGGAAGELVLRSSLLNSFGAESLLIGGLRSFTQDGVSVSVNTGNLTLDNGGSALTGSDIILVADEKLTLRSNSKISATGDEKVLDAITIGDSAVSGSGDGALVRVSGSASGRVSRTGVDNATTAELAVGNKTSLAGGSIFLDSSYATRLSGSATIDAGAVSLSSGQISILLDNPGKPQGTNGLVLSGSALATLQQSAARLALTSYSSIDVYGTGQVGSRDFQELSLRSAAIRGFNTGGGTVSFSADQILIDNLPGRTASGVAGSNGRIRFDAGVITLGTGGAEVRGYDDTVLAADRGILVSGTGSFSASGNVRLVTPVVTGESAANHKIVSGGLLQLDRPGGNDGDVIPGGFGAELALEGKRVDVDGNIVLSSGELTLNASNGDVRIGATAAARIDVGGVATRFVDITRYTSGGIVNLVSGNGSVEVGKLGSVSVSAQNGGGNAGFISVETPGGILGLSGVFDGSAGKGGRSGGFSMDAGSVSGGNLADLDAALNSGNFNELRDYRIRTGDVTVGGLAQAKIYRVAADDGDIVVTGRVDASGETGGTIDFKANGSLIVRNSAVLDASAERFDSAGKGGAVILEAGNQSNGIIDASAMLDLRGGALIDLTVSEKNSQSDDYGKFSGTLHLRAPRNAGNTDLNVAEIGSTIRGESAILAEGVKLYEVTGAGTITTALQNSIRNDATAFLGDAGTTTAGYTAMLDRLTSSQPGLDLILAPGVEIYNLNGSITLGTTSSTATSDWNLSNMRFGPKGAAGVLTLRASDNLVFHNALSDGFSGGSSLWLSPLMANNLLLPANMQSWSFRLGAGADLSAASFREVRSLEELGETSGFFQLGKNRGSATATGGQNATTASAIGNAFQVIRTGSGDIDVHAGRSIQFLNPFASIYTAGTQVADPTSVSSTGDFQVPVLSMSPALAQTALGAVQQIYPAQYSMAGGDVTLNAGLDIERKTRNNSGLIDDSSRQMPNNWLYRRGYIGPDGNFGAVDLGTATRRFNDPAASTSWWVDHSNFFQSVGTLGGGNVALTAGNDVRNVDAVAPTNARAPKGSPDRSKLVELGGGDVTVRAGNDISGGVYYVERGEGIIEAGHAITTNSTRSPSFGLVANLNNPAAATLDPLTWIPTLLFAGKSSFDVSARGDILLGPTYNPFLLPTGLNNKFWYKTYFSTFAPESATQVTSLGGDITLRNAITLPGRNSAVSVLRAWMETQNLLSNSNTSSAWSQPWLRLGETSVNAFNPVLSLAAPTLKLSALSGDVNVAGNLTLASSSTGQLELISAGSISGLQPTGLSNTIIAGQPTMVWTAGTINLSDADPDAVPDAFSPINYFGIAGDSGAANVTTQDNFLSTLLAMFTESGSFTGANGSIQFKQSLHSQGLLHRDDEDPVRVYAMDGDLSGLTLFTPKFSRIFASRDITDVALHIQNLASGNLSIVSAGRDLVAYNSNSQSRVQALSSGNAVSFGQSALSGDIQISGPGTLQVLAGRTLDLGVGNANADGTATGITSIGNFRNPFLSTKGADLLIGAGMTAAPSLGGGAPDFDAFIEKFVLTEKGRKYLREVAPGVEFSEQSGEEQARLAMEVFYQILRDTGRDFNDPDSDGFQNYKVGKSAVRTLFGKDIAWEGEVLTRNRDIRTRSGGDIGIIAPGGGVTMSDTSSASSLTPPGVITEAGGNISIFTDQDVSIGIGRIFTLRGGDITIWSSRGDIAAGSSSRTIQSAPPTRVIVDPQSASVETDLAGLATGGGIGVLATVEGVEAGDVDLIAPTGIIDAGDAGIRVSGNINLAAVQVVNAANISAGGNSTGAPAAVSAPSISTTTSASNASAAATSTAVNPAEQRQTTEAPAVGAEEPSLISVEVIGYGGGTDEDEEEEDKESEATE
ncbi:MAG: filamentous hemagglutinin family protein, partial [Verrucomicrobiota bacterium]